MPEPHFIPERDAGTDTSSGDFSQLPWGRCVPTARSPLAILGDQDAAWKEIR